MNRNELLMSFDPSLERMCNPYVLFCGLPSHAETVGQMNSRTMTIKLAVGFTQLAIGWQVHQPGPVVASTESRNNWNDVGAKLGWSE